MHSTGESIYQNVPGINFRRLGSILFPKAPVNEVSDPSVNRNDCPPTNNRWSVKGPQLVRNSLPRRSVSFNGDFTISIDSDTDAIDSSKNNVSPTSVSCKVNFKLDFDGGETKCTNTSLKSAALQRKVKRNSNYPFTPMVLAEEICSPNSGFPGCKRVSVNFHHPSDLPCGDACNRPSEVPCISINIPLDVPLLPPRADRVSHAERSTTTPPGNGVHDLHQINRTMKRLHQSCWFYEGINWRDGVRLLENSSVGTFLMRESADPVFLFSLSVQTDKGPTSVRIHYTNGQFQLDAVNTIYQSMPKFDCVVSLVDYYVKLGQSYRGRSHVWVDKCGAANSRLKLSKPLYKCPPPLKQLTVVKVNSLVPSESIPSLPLPKYLQNCLESYPGVV